MKKRAEIRKRFPYWAITFLTIISANLFSQNGIQQAVEVWRRIIPGPQQYSSSLGDMVLDDQGNIYIAGSFENAPNPTYITIVKFSPLGEQLWFVNYQTENNNSAKDIAVDPLGNVYVVGTTFEMYKGLNGLILKYDINGNLLWNAAYDGPDHRNDRFQGVLLDAAGYVYVYGYSIGLLTKEDYITLKYDVDGNLLWCARYNGASNHTDMPSRAALDNNGNIYVTGQSYREAPGTAYDWGAPDYATVKYDPNGNQQMVLLYNGFEWPPYYNLPDQAMDIIIDASNCIYVGGTSSELGWTTLKYDFSGNVLWSVRSNRPPVWGEQSDMLMNNNGDLYLVNSNTVVKINSTGNQAWVINHYTSMGDDFGTDKIVSDDEGNLYICGSTLIKYDPNGAVVWSKNIGDEYWSSAIAEDASGQLYYAGMDLGRNGLWLVKYTQTTTYEQPTPTGENVAVTFGDGVNVIFQSVENGGVTSVVESDLGPLPPSNFEIIPLGEPTYYDISSTCQFTAPIIVEIPYDESKLGGVPEENLRLFHYEGETPVDITLFVDADNNRVVGQTMSLSVFVLAAPQSISPIQAIETLISDVEALHLPIGLENSLVSKLENSIESYRRDNYLATVNQLNAFINQVNAQRGKKISNGDAGRLIGSAELIISNIHNGLQKRVRPDGNEQTTKQIPSDYALYQNYPNPFNSCTMVEYQIPEDQHVSLKVFNCMGCEVATLVNEKQQAGRYKSLFDATDLPSGIYFFRMATEQFETKNKFLIIK